jgi:hypothetical protein
MERTERAFSIAGQVGLGAIALAVAVAALASTYASYADRQRGPADVREPEPVVASPWADMPDAERRFSLTGNLFGREPNFYVARRNLAGGGRLDQLAFGGGDELAPHLRISIYRPLDEPVGEVSFWLEMARRAGEAGLALERAQPVPALVRTRLGPFEVGALTTVGGETTPRYCLGFRQRSDSPALVMSGIACLGGGASDPVFSREALVCALEAITLRDNDGDAELKAYFEGSEPRSCGAGRPPQAGG